MSVDQQRFWEAKEKVTKEATVRSGIGTLQEKTIHAVMKQYYEPDPDRQEKEVCGLVADIFTGQEIIEIQTRNFYPLKKKLATLLPHWPVTIVYPIPHKKWVIWIDEATGELSQKRRSPKTGTAYDAFRELYKIKEFLKEEKLTIKLVFLDLEEYRLLNGWSRDRKRGSHRYDRIPLDIVGEEIFSRPKDYGSLIPDGLEEPFSTKDFAKAARIKQTEAGRVVHILYYLKQIERVGKNGNFFLYQCKENEKSN